MSLRIMVEPQQGATYSQILRAAQAAENAGFEGFFRSDHLLAMDGSSGLPGPTDAWLTLAGLARETTRIRLGTLVTAATFREPSLLAIQVAQVDEMSHGRVELGLGAAWFEAEHQAHGLAFFDTKIRFDRLEEQVKIISGLWATPVGEHFTFLGHHYQVRESPGLPKPFQKPLPLIIGGTGRHRTPALAASQATEFNAPFLSLTETAAAFDRARAACLRIGRAPEDLIISAAQGIACGVSNAEVERRAAPAGISFERFRSENLAGSPDHIAEEIARFLELGCQRLYLQLPDLEDEDHINLIAGEVGRQLPDNWKTD